MSESWIQNLKTIASYFLAGTFDEKLGKPFDQYFMKSIAAPTTIATLVTVDQNDITLTSAANFTVGDMLIIASGSEFFTGSIVVKATNVLTVDTPLHFAFPVGSIVIPLNNNMAVDGSTTPQIFTVESGSGIEVDIHRALFSMLSASAMDDGLFGNLPALEYGLVLRINNGDGTYYNLWNAKTNGDLRLLTGDVEYADKAPSGSYGVGSRYTLGGETKHGTIVRLAAQKSLEIVVQDDLSVLDSLYALAAGHILE